MLVARILIHLLMILSCHAVRAQAGDAGSQPVSDLPAEEQAPLASEPSVEELQRARVLFQRGVQFAQKQEFAAAAKRFREALAMHYAPAVDYNLASALFETGQYAESYNRTQSVLQHPDTNESLRSLAERLERSLRQHVARLTLLTSGEPGEIAVRVDGEPLAPELLGVPQAVTPGNHQIVATRGETTISDREVTIPVRTAAIVDVSLFVTPQEAAAGVEVSSVEGAPLAPAVVDSGPRSDSRGKRDWRLWTGIAAGAIAVGVGVTLAITLSGDKSESSNRPVQGDSQPGVLTW